MKPLPPFYMNSTCNSTLMYSSGLAVLLGIVILVSLSCSVAEDNEVLTDLEQARLSFEQYMEDPDNMTILFPDQDPGIPIYARVGPILNQFFVTENLLVIPFYRDTDCIREDFNFLDYYDPPVAFGCELNVEGKFVIENDAEEGSFPIMAHTQGTQVSLWIVDWHEFQALLENESVTLPELEALNPVKAVAQQYEEYLSPRFHEHEVVIEAQGIILNSDQQFTFNLTHREDQIETITLILE